jgi:hypothetical protein
VALLNASKVSVLSLCDRTGNMVRRQEDLKRMSSKAFR